MDDLVKRWDVVHGEIAADKTGHWVSFADHKAAIERLSARIAALESGQPVPHRGEMWQLVRVELTPNVMNSMEKCRQNHPHATSFNLYTAQWAYALTASAQEAQEDKT